MGQILGVSGGYWEGLEVTGIGVFPLEPEGVRMWEPVENSVGPQRCSGGQCLGHHAGRSSAGGRIGGERSGTVSVRSGVTMGDDSQ